MGNHLFRDIIHNYNITTMYTKIGLADLLEPILEKLDMVIKDRELKDSLNDIKINRTNGLELFYSIKDNSKLLVPQVSASEILADVEYKEGRFEEFWEKYNKKRNKEKTFAKFKRLSRKEIDKIFETLDYYIKATPDVQFRKDPITYLNQKTWEDEDYLPKKQVPIQRNDLFKF